MELKQYFYHQISRIRLYEVEKAPEEKIADGWELHTPIVPQTRVGTRWGVSDRKTYSLDQYEGSLMTQKYICTVKKEKSKVIAGRNVSC
jgi:hypothetical protein